jgi:hypothetical protein
MDAAVDDVHDGSAKMNGFVKTTGALSNSTTDNLSNTYVKKDDATWS